MGQLTLPFDDEPKVVERIPQPSRVKLAILAELEVERHLASLAPEDRRRYYARLAAEERRRVAESRKR